MSIVTLRPFRFSAPPFRFSTPLVFSDTSTSGCTTVLFPSIMIELNVSLPLALYIVCVVPPLNLIVPRFGINVPELLQLPVKVIARSEGVFSNDKVAPEAIVIFFATAGIEALVDVLIVSQRYRRL